jgi:hypothetical protein
MALPTPPPMPFMDWLQQAADCKSLRFVPLLAIAFLFAALGFWFGPARALFASAEAASNLGTVTLCIWIGWFWIGVCVSALVLHGKRALWLLPGAPFALIWPLLWVVQAPECSLVGCL